MSGYNEQCGHVECKGLSACVAQRTITFTSGSAVGEPLTPEGMWHTTIPPLSRKEEADLRKWVATVEPKGTPTETARLLATLDAARVAAPLADRIAADAIWKDLKVETDEAHWDLIEDIRDAVVDRIRIEEAHRG